MFFLADNFLTFLLTSSESIGVGIASTSKCLTLASSVFRTSNVSSASCGVDPDTSRPFGVTYTDPLPSLVTPKASKGIAMCASSLFSLLSDATKCAVDFSFVPCSSLNSACEIHLGAPFIGDFHSRIGCRQLGSIMISGAGGHRTLDIAFFVVGLSSFYQGIQTLSRYLQGTS